MPTISVIVPVYNSDSYLKKCIESILAQEFTDFELLCIDDGSTDNSGKILDKISLADNRIKVFHNSNHGVSYTRNFGISKATSPYIVFIDSDDTVSPSYLHALYNDINNEVQLAICGVEVSNELPNEKSIHKKNNIVDFTEKSESKLAFCITNKYFNYAWGKIFCTDVIINNNIRFNENVSLGEDTIFVTEYLKYTDKFLLIDTPLYFYNKHGGSLTSTNRNDLFECFTATTDSIEKLFVYKNIFGKVVQSAIDQRRAIAAEWACYPIFHSDIQNKSKRSKIILKDDKLVKSLKRLKKENKLNQIQKIMCFRNPFFLKIYYYRIEGKLSVKNIIKTLLHI